MFDKFKIIQIFGERYNVRDLLVHCKEIINDPEVADWEKDIYHFLQELFSSSKTIIVETSGSTGNPKTISIEKEHLIASAIATLTFLDLAQNDNIWLCLPVKYIAGRMMIVRSIVGGLNLLYSKPASNPVIEMDANVDFVSMVPNQVFELLTSKDGVRQLSKIKTLLIGGSGISQELEDRLLSVSDINAWHSYGMTETITHIALRKLSPDNNTGKFTLLPGIGVSANPNDQLIIDAPEIGVFDLVTNDIVSINADGTFIILGRADTVVISGGIKLFPEIIESKIAKHMTDNFFVGAIADEKLGEKLTLFIESSANEHKVYDSLKQIFVQELKEYEIPKKVICLPRFLRTETGKIKRKESIGQILT